MGSHDGRAMSEVKPDNVLILPGWQNSGPDHWQSRWEVLHGYRRVEQHDWMTPKRGDWMARLEEVVLGCQLTAAWAAHSQNTGRVIGALLVAPPDTERADVRGLLPSWAPIPLKPLPFLSVLVASTDDPYGGFDRAQGFATAWGSRFVDMGAAGHINAETGLGDWAEGLGLLATELQLKVGL